MISFNETRPRVTHCLSSMSNHLQGVINVCTEVLHLHGHLYNPTLMFNKENKPCYISRESSSDTITYAKADSMDVS